MTHDNRAYVKLAEKAKYLAEDAFSRGGTRADLARTFALLAIADRLNALLEANAKNPRYDKEGNPCTR